MPRRALLLRLSDMGIQIADEELFAAQAAKRVALSARAAFASACRVHPAPAEDFAGLTCLGDQKPS